MWFFSVVHIVTTLGAEGHGLRILGEARGLTLILRIGGAVFLLPLYEHMTWTGPTLVKCWDST
jgi:hypothetical protein